MGSRRRFLHLSLGAFCGLPLFRGLAAAARPRPGIVLLDGWVLTARDMEALGRHDR